MQKKASKPSGKGTNQLPAGVRAHKFTRTRDFGLVSKAALDTGGSLQFTLDQVPSYAELTTLYDAYSIDRVEVTFVWFAPYVGATAGAAQMPVMVITPDYDDANPVTTVNEIGEYGQARVVPFTTAKNSHTISVVPRAAKQMFRGVTSGYSWAEKSAVIDAGNIDVPHYGLKWFTQHYNSTYHPDSLIKIYVKFHLTGYAVR